MKKLIICLLLVAYITLLFGCGIPTRLTIRNTSGQTLEMVCWNGHYFGNDEIYDTFGDDWFSCMRNYSSVTREVEPGWGYVTFWLVNGGEYQTIYPIRVSEEESRIFYLDYYQVNQAICIFPVALGSQTLSQKKEDLNLLKQK
ncbi:MAG TPA: hypothetical protein VHY08_10315 [Bacillota bacterium]|nr:hypothetical protein [Bacillota bacterium]